MLGYGSIFGGCGAGAGFAAGLGASCGMVAMSSVYGDGGRETSDLEHDPAESGDEEALQVPYAVAVGDTPLAVGFSDPQKIDLRLLAVGESGLVELLGIHAESEVSRRQHKDGSNKSSDRTEDSGEHEDCVNRLLSEREAAVDGRPGEQSGQGAGTGEHWCCARAQVRDDLALLVEGRTGQVVDHFLEARGHIGNRTPTRGHCGL